MKHRQAKRHTEIQDHITERLKNKAVSKILQNSVNTKVTTQLDGTIQTIKVKFNVGGGFAYINTGKKTIESRVEGVRRSHPLIDEPEAKRKIEMIKQHLETQHKKLR
jgi:RNase adaptor protein for sRNA GlmZ degradation